MREFARIVVWSPTRANLEAYAAEMRAEGFDVHLADGPAAVCSDADVLITTTPSRAPLVAAGSLRAGMHVTAVGSDSPGKQELEAACLAAADLVVADRLSQCAAFGELAGAVDGGLVQQSSVIELGAIVCGRRPGRVSDEQLTIADLTGVGFQDTAIASAAFDRIVERRERSERNN